MRVFGAVHAFLRGLAEQGPVLLALEDIHGAIATSLQLVRYLVRHTANLPLLIVGTYRSDEVERGGALAELLGWIERERPGERWVIDPLTADHAAHLTAALLDGPTSARLEGSLYAATGGNPLFIEQLVLGLKEAGRIEQHRGFWDGAVGPGEALTPVMRDVIDQRFARLSEACRATLSMAAVFGQTASHRSLLASADSRDETALLAELDEALEARLLQETPGGYAFVHGLLRDAVYASLSGPTRMRLHRRAGETLERLAGSRVRDQAAELAYHFNLAGMTPEIVAKALHYSLEAGRRCTAIAAHPQAMTFFNRACELLEAQVDEASPQAWLDALEGRVSAERALWLWKPLIEDANRLLELSTEPSARARARSAIGFARQQTGDTSAALREYEAALAELEPAEQTPDIVVARLRLQVEQAYIWFLRGRFVAMLAQADQILSKALELGRARPLFWAQNIVALAHYGSGQVDRAVPHYRLACAAAEGTDDKVDQAVARSNLGIQYFHASQLELAEAELEAAIALYRDAAADRRTANPMQVLARTWLARGEVDRAFSLATQACSIATEAGDRWASACHDALGMIHCVRGEWEAAEDRFSRAARAREGVDHAEGQIDTLLGVGLVYQRRGEWASARTSYERAAEIAGAMDPNPWAVGARRQLGRLLYLVGEKAQAVEQLEQAFVMVGSMTGSEEYAPTLLTLAELDWRADGPEAALRRAEQALAAGMSAERTAEAHLELAGLQRRLGNSARARGHVAEARAIAGQLGSPRLVGLAHLAAGQVASGGPAEAIVLFEAAIGVFDQARLPFERSLALVEHASAIDAQAAGEQRGRDELKEAAEMFRRLGATQMVDLCFELLQASGG